MKRIFFISTFVVCILNANAGNTLIVPSITAPQGGSENVEVSLENTDSFTSFQMTLTLPKGISLTSCVGSSRLGEHTCSYTPVDETRTLLTCYPKNLTQPTSISSSDGVLFVLTLFADATLTTGTILEAMLDEVKFSDFDELPIPLEGVTFNITIGEPADTRILLDENSTTAPETFTNVDVRVKRTINANEWSTICLPFAMTETQVKETFGNDVQLADFTGIDSELDANNNVVGITVNFAYAQQIEANHPYIIKVSSPVSEFTIDGVDITPSEEPSVDRDEQKVKIGSKWFTFYNSFFGTYLANTEVPKNCLFLNGNKFWYSTGATRMKAFRAYFDFIDVLTEVEDASNVKLWVNDDDDNATGIETTGHSSLNIKHCYNLAGQRVSKSYKGIIINNGKKIKK